MTIYTSIQTEKKPDKGTVPEDVAQLVSSTKDEGDAEEAGVVAKAIRVNYLHRSRRSFCIHVLLTVLVLVILACGAIGALVFYRHLNKKVYTGVCGNVYFDTIFHTKGNALSDAPAAEYSQSSNMDFLEEKIEVSEVDLHEQQYTPHFDEVQENFVWHDFSKNYTTIIDHLMHHCYVMPLNRTAIAPPRDLIDLIKKLMSGYYMPKARVIRENYRMVRPPMTDLEPLSKHIYQTCVHYQTFWLEKIHGNVVKRSAEVFEPLAVYAILSNFPEHQEIFKISVFDPEQATHNSDQV